MTAEGIENEAVIGNLLNGGCSEGQGYYFGKAVPPDAAMRMLDVAAPPVLLREAPRD